MIDTLRGIQWCATLFGSSLDQTIRPEKKDNRVKDHQNDPYVAHANVDVPPHGARPDAVSDLARRAIARLCASATAKPGHAKAPCADPARASDIIGDPVASALAYSLCDDEPDVAQAIIDDLLDAGVSAEDI